MNAPTVFTKRSPIDELIDRNLECYELAIEHKMYEFSRTFLDNARCLVAVNTAAERELGI